MDTATLLAKTSEQIEALKARQPEVRFWIGVFKPGGHGDWLTACALARAAKRHWQRRLERDAGRETWDAKAETTAPSDPSLTSPVPRPPSPLGVIVIGRETGMPEDFDLAYGQPRIDAMLRVPEFNHRLQAGRCAPHFDVFYRGFYAIKTSFKAAVTGCRSQVPGSSPQPGTCHPEPSFFSPIAEQLAADERLSDFRDLYDHTMESNNLLGKRYQISQWDLMSATAGFRIGPEDLAVPTECAKLDGFAESPLLDCGLRIADCGLGAEIRNHQSEIRNFAGCVTIHNSEGGAGRTKCLPPDVPAAIVAALLARGERVVQVGARDPEREPPIQGAVDLRGLRMPETARVIRAARLHVDVEGGLVYVAKAVGTPAVVFFGPTPPVVFGFPGNLNTTRAICPPPYGPHCWWAKPDWFYRCPHGCPSCLNLPQPETAAALVLKALGALPKRLSVVGCRLSGTEKSENLRSTVAPESSSSPRKPITENRQPSPDPPDPASKGASA